jgi:hypothetical protein
MKVPISVPIERRQLRKAVRESLRPDVFPPGMGKHMIRRVREATVKAFCRADDYMELGSGCNVATISDKNFYVKVDVDTGRVDVFWKIV